MVFLLSKKKSFQFTVEVIYTIIQYILFLMPLLLLLFLLLLLLQPTLKLLLLLLCVLLLLFLLLLQLQLLLLLLLQHLLSSYYQTPVMTNGPVEVADTLMSVLNFIFPSSCNLGI